MDKNYNSILDWDYTVTCNEYDNDKECLDTKEVINYAYISNDLVTDEYNELVNLRTSNKRYFPNKVKIYLGDPFTELGGNWYSVETRQVETVIFEDYVNSLLTLISGANAQTDILAEAGCTYNQTPDLNNTWDVYVNHDGTGNSVLTTGDIYVVWCRSDNPTNDWKGLIHNDLYFNFYGISDEVATATLYIYGSSKTDGNSITPTVNVYPADPHDPVQADDFNDYSTSTPLSDSAIAYADWDTAGWNSWVFNSDGIDYINDTCIVDGHCSVGTLMNHDVSGVNPGAGTNVVTSMLGRSWDYTGTANDPYLEIEYAPTSTPPTSTATATPGSIIPLNDIAIIQGYVEHYTDSTTTPSEVEYIVYHIPFFVWLFFWLVLSFLFGRVIIELLIILRG